MPLAFALTQHAEAPSDDEIASAYGQLWPDAPMTGSFQIVAVPGPVPEGEAEHTAQFSVASLGRASAPHNAHVVIAYTPPDDLSALGELVAFTRLVAALLVAARAQAVYWADSGATHPAGFFVEMAQNVELPLPLWSGVSQTRTADGRISLLSLGMAQLALPDLLLTARPEAAQEALVFFYDLLAYVAGRGEVLRAGETTGRTAEEQLVVRHEQSPLDDELTVFRVDLP